MESGKNSKIEKRKFRLYEHPWLSLLAVILASLVAMILASIIVFGLLKVSDRSLAGMLAQPLLFHFLTIFLLTPFVLRLPLGKRTYRQYLEDIGLTRLQPFLRLVLLALTSYVILAASQAAASFVYRFSEGLPINGSFIRQVFDLSGVVYPDSPSLLVSIPSMFEEAVFRGILLTVFLSRYSERQAIVFSSIGFGLIHLLNLTNGRDPTWVLGQVVWAFIIGLFYGYVFVKTRSLLPSMIVHYLGNVSIGALTGYLQARASVEIQVLYGVTLSLGVVPVSLMILWARFFASRWLPPARRDVEKTAVAQSDRELALDG